jgi:hypothetical protein
MVYTPTFSAPAESRLGINAATLTNLAIVKTLREAPYPNPQKLNFGHGCVEWTLGTWGTQLPGLNSIVTVANAYDAQMVLDGDAYPYGTGAVVTARLYMTPRPRAGSLSRVWRIAIEPATAAASGAAQTRAQELVLDAIPEREFEFRSVALVGNDLAAYDSPDLLEVHRGGPKGPVVGRIGDGFRALRQEATSAEVITYSGIHGYIETPIPRREVTAIGDFVGAIIRLLRSDWDGALALFSQADQSTALPLSLSVDAQLMSAYCLEQRGQNGRRSVEKAADLSPSAPRVLKARTMVLLAEIVRSERARDAASVGRQTAEYRRAVAALSQALGSDDPWVQQATAISATLHPPLTPQTHNPH